jgi:hypothetical protein
LHIVLLFMHFMYRKIGYHTLTDYVLPDRVGPTTSIKKEPTEQSRVLWVF